MSFFKSLSHGLHNVGHFASNAGHDLFNPATYAGFVSHTGLWGASLVNGLMKKHPGLQDEDPMAPPSRDDVQMNVLQEQLSALEKKRGQLGTMNPGDSTSTLAQSALFGM